MKKIEDQVKFSIITTTYNRLNSGYLQSCITSIINQKPGNYTYEHIIIDDGSTDDTRHYVENIKADDSRIVYLYQQNQGSAAATKTGIMHATGDYVVIVDDDDMLTPDSLSIRCEFIETNKDIDFFYGLAEWMDEFGLPVKNKFQSVFFKSFLYENMLVSNCINAGTPTTKLSALKFIKWPSWLNRSQDYFLWLEILRPENNFNVAFLDAVVFKYRFHANNYTATLNTTEKKNEKDTINYKIKSLHNPSKVFLAEQAYEWAKEAERLNQRQETLTQEHSKEIEYANRHVSDLMNSRYIRYSVKVRNVLKGQVVDRVSRTKNRLINKQLKTTKEPDYEFVKVEKWENKRPLVSVITPFYNRADTMPDTIGSVLRQSFQDFEYIIVNDGSTDANSINYLNKIIHPKITVVHTANQGVSGARNSGIKAAKGKYILCLDSDDIIDSTYLEKAIITLESNPEASIVSFDMQTFGKSVDIFRYPPFNPYMLLEDNPISTAAVFRKSVWNETDGYRSEIGYEDWEFWVNAVEHGHFPFHIPEVLFHYRTAANSRYIDDLLNHNANTSAIKMLHPSYRQNIKKIVNRKQMLCKVTDTKASFTNVSDADQYKLLNDKPNVLITIPWMSFGGVSTLVYNYCLEIKNDFNISFITGLKHENEWEHKFRETSEYIYHLPNLYREERFYQEFVCNYIKTHNISILHIVHNGFIFDMLPEIRKRYPNIKVIVTLFNDKVNYFENAIKYSEYIDTFSSDNRIVDTHYKKDLKAKKHTDIKLIENGINTDTIFAPTLFNRVEERRSLGILNDDLAVFYIGRLSEEKNPDIFIKAAKVLIEKHPNIKFYIIGDGPMKNEVEAQISNIGNVAIQYLGYQSDIPRYLSAADIFVLPSSIEGFPLSVPEAMSMQVAVIASRVGAVPDIIEHGVNGFVVEPEQHDEIVTVVSEMYNKRDELKQVKIKAREKAVKKYSAKLLGENYKELYRGDK